MRLRVASGDESMWGSAENQPSTRKVLVEVDALLLIRIPRIRLLRRNPTRAGRKKNEGAIAPSLFGLS
jgi:hypothetical protein